MFLMKEDLKMPLVSSKIEKKRNLLYFVSFLIQPTKVKRIGSFCISMYFQQSELPIELQFCVQ